jgi:hypothetical protein|tara:strand:+ start:867 stop:2006 length:1140 start_codon:yes stop_codon:yes gene_type:complete
MDIFNNFLNKFSYKFDKGYPDMNDPKDVLLLESLLSDLLGEKFEITEIENKKGTREAVQHIIDTLGNKYDFVIKKDKTRLGIEGKKEEQFFLDLFQEAFPDEKLDIKIVPKNTFPNPSGMFNMYVFDTEEFDKVSIVVSNKPPGGDGKGPEADFVDNINNLIEENGGEATVVITSPEYTLSFDNITKAVDSSKTGAGKGDKSDAQLLSGNEVKANISIKLDGGFRWASVASLYKPFITNLFNKALKAELTDLKILPNPSAPGKYLMYDPNTDERVTKVIIPDFPKDDINKWTFGPEIPKTFIVSKPAKADYSLEDGVVTMKTSHIYTKLEDLEEVGIDPVFAIMQHRGTSQGLDYRIIPAKQAKITAGTREISYNEIMD